MLKQMNFIELLKVLKNQIEESTGLKCFDKVPKNAKSPFYFIEVISKKPKESKTMYIDKFTVWIHSIAEEANSSVPVLNMINMLDECLTVNIPLPEEYTLIMQGNNGLIQLKNDEETNEEHGVTEVYFDVCYGLKCK